MDRSNVSIPSGDSELAAWVYRPPADAASGACVVMGHGFSLTRHDGLSPIAEAFATAGATVVCFDYRFFGDSGGQPRQRFRASAQQEDWRNAIAFARGLDGVNPDKIVAWGYSFGGGHCVNVAAGEGRLAAMMLLYPFLDGPGRVKATSLKLLAFLGSRALADLAGVSVTVPVTGPPGSRGAMSLPGESAGFASVVRPDSPWRNEITPGVFATLVAHRPWTKAASLRMPIWVGLGERDITVPAAGIRRLVERAPNAQLHRYDTDHFEVFAEPHLGRLIEDQIEFLRQCGLIGVPA